MLMSVYHGCQLSDRNSDPSIREVRRLYSTPFKIHKQTERISKYKRVHVCIYQLILLYAECTQLE